MSAHSGEFSGGARGAAAHLVSAIWASGTPWCAASETDELPAESIGTGTWAGMPGLLFCTRPSVCECVMSICFLPGRKAVPTATSSEMPGVCLPAMAFFFGGTDGLSGIDGAMPVTLSETIMMGSDRGFLPCGGGGGLRDCTLPAAPMAGSGPGVAPRSRRLGARPIVDVLFGAGT